VRVSGWREIGPAAGADPDVDQPFEGKEAQEEGEQGRSTGEKREDGVEHFDGDGAAGDFLAGDGEEMGGTKSDIQGQGSENPAVGSVSTDLAGGGGEKTPAATFGDELDAKALDAGEDPKEEGKDGCVGEEEGDTQQEDGAVGGAAGGIKPEDANPGGGGDEPGDGEVDQKEGVAANGIDAEGSKEEARSTDETNGGIKPADEAAADAATILPG